MGGLRKMGYGIGHTRDACELGAHLTSLAAAYLPSPSRALLSVAWVVSSDTPSGIGKSLGSPNSQRMTASWRSEACCHYGARLCDPVLARTCEGDEGPRSLVDPGVDSRSREGHAGGGVSWLNRLREGYVRNRYQETRG